MLDKYWEGPVDGARHDHVRQVQDAQNLVNVAKLYPLTDGGIQTSQLLSDALHLDPDNHDASVLQERLHQMFVPRWHYPMLADTVRNEAYAKAIQAKVQPDDIVLDIGCGAGLTAMLAARAGARHVYTCEVQPLIAQAATQVIEQNGLSDRITVIPKSSKEIVVGVDIPEPADVVVSEIVDTVLLGEGALETLSHAMSHLAKPEARAIPEYGMLNAQPVESFAMQGLYRPQEAEGFDLTAFHRFSRLAQLTPNDFSACDLRSLGSSENLFRFDFLHPNTEAGHTVTRLTTDKPGTIHAVLVSFVMQLAEGVVLTNGLQSTGHWGRTAILLDCPRAATKGDQLEIIAQHDASHLSVRVL